MVLDVLSSKSAMKERIFLKKNGGQQAFEKKTIKSILLF